MRFIFSDFLQTPVKDPLPWVGKIRYLMGAARDPDGANLDRIQVVKGWQDAKGKLREKVYDVAWAGNREPGSNGKLPPVGNTVDLETATYANTIGEAFLSTTWSDPDFDPREKSFYYARVIEIPTPRWTAFDELRFNFAMDEGVTRVIQERAYTSPIWYTPEG